MPNTLHEILKSQLQDIHAGWSIGSFGAIGEFHQRSDDDITVDDSDALTRATQKGAIRLDSDRLKTVLPVAYETLSPRAHRWSQGMALCLKKEEVTMSRRFVLTELGLDKEAIRPEDRDAILFDMGLNQYQIDFCIRTKDAGLIEILRDCIGEPLSAPDHPAMAAILNSHPHRVVLSKLGRVEVFQKIGGPATGGVSPDGPHTHVLPKLLKAGRTHSANTPIPQGYVPSASLHPASPVMGSAGEDIPFDNTRYEAFQHLLSNYGLKEYIEVKEAILKACNENVEATGFTPPNTRLGRVALRNSLRQLRRLAHYHNSDDNLAWLNAWQSNFDQSAELEDTEDELLGHQIVKP